MNSQSTEEIKNWLVQKISKVVGINTNDLDIYEPFANMGLDSASAVSLSGELEDWLDLKLSPTLVFDYPNIDSLSRHLAEKSQSKT